MVQVADPPCQASHDDLVGRARELVPQLRKRLNEMDQLGRLPEATVADDIEAWARRGEFMEYMNRARVRQDSSYAARLLFEAAEIIIEASGGSFAAAHNPLNHFWRDMRTGSLHAFLTPSTNQELYGRLLCGQPANTPLV